MRFTEKKNIFQQIPLVYGLFTFLIFSLNTSCQESQKPNLETVSLISGQLGTDSIPKIYLFKERGFLTGTLIDSAPVENRSFNLSVDNLEEGYFSIRSSNATTARPKVHLLIYLLAEDSLYIRIDDEGVNYGGTSAHLQDYRSKSWEFISQDSIYKTIYQPRYEIAKYEMKEAISILEYVRKIQLDFFNQTFEDQLLPEKYKKIQIAQVEQDIANKYFWYLRYHRHMTEEERTYAYLKADDSYYSFLDRFDLDDPSNANFNYLYSLFLDNYMNDLFFRTKGVYSEDDRLAYVQNAENTELKFKVDWIKENLKGVNRDLGFYALLNGQRFKRAIKDSLELFYKDLEEIDAYLKMNYTDSSIINPVRKICADYFKIKPGAKAPKLELPNLEGNLVALEDFRTKVVYIDFWGSWCGPCIAAIPKYKELQQKFKEDEVIFLNIALEYNQHGIDSWKKFLAKNDFPGTHIVAEGSFHNEQIQPLMINIAPSYMLINKEGKIVTPRAPKPEQAADLIRMTLAD